ncbi:MAG TPA: protein kinase [Candidatus Sulfomarinibacteraceae bacterium]|nr:protein kinase [Candidatus Sulfomarinibacteraceae bacterium]
MLQIYLFGAPRIERDGDPVSISRRKAIALLAYLAVTGQPHSRDTLAAMLWPDYDQSGARANLRRDLSRLKQSVGDDVLLVDRSQVAMNRDAEWWLDVAAFSSGLQEVSGHRHEEQPLCDECAAQLADVAALYTADFMAGFTLPDSPAFDDWQFFEAEGLRQDLAEGLQHLVDWHVHKRTYEGGIEYARRWLALDSLHEAAHRRLMQLYAWAGQQAAALRQYEECVRLLDEELGVEPEEETTALYEQIKSRQLQPPTPQPPAPSAAAAASAPPAQLTPQERFEAGELLAVGGHAHVYHGRDRVTGQPVVIKRLKAELVVKDPDYVARFVREGEALRQLEHPNIVHMLAAYEEENQQQIVMEFVSGGTLRDLLDEGPLPLSQALDIALELADALARAHHLNIIHRDLKPDNVLMAADGTPRLTDFGLAYLKRDDMRLTQTGAIIGSPAYMSPEALRGDELDARSDIWSFGVLLYEMLAGRKPFQGEQLTPVLVSILHEPAPPISQFRPEAPQALTNLLSRMLVKEQARRLSSMRQVAAELEAIRNGSASDAGHPQLVPALPSTPSPQPLEVTPAPPPEPARGVIAAATPFVGRRQELAEIRDMFLADTARASRLLTLLGPGGTGKTRLAAQVAQLAGDFFTDGVVFVSLAPLTEASQVVRATAGHFNFRFFENAEPRKQLLDYLRERQLLLVMDNFEHVLGAADLVSEILEAASRVKILVTSRERLNLSGESVYALGGMDVPDENSTREEALEHSAVQLLLQRARMVRPDLTLDDEELRHVIRICRLVGGMPLALVLAAGWLEMLSFEEIGGEIAHSLDFLESQARDVPERQRSMRAVFDSSWKLLNDEERNTLTALSVFQGSFTREAARAVSGASLFTLLALLHKSWLQRAEGDRFQVHELLRQFSAQKLEEDADAWRQARQRHAAHYADFLAQQAEKMHGPQQQEAFEAVHADFENVRLAWNWLVQEKQPETVVDRMLPALYHYCEDRVKAFDLMTMVDTAVTHLDTETTELEQSLLTILLTARAAFFRNGFPIRLEAFGMFVPADVETLQRAWSLSQNVRDDQCGFWIPLLCYTYGRIVDWDQGTHRLRQLFPVQRRRNRRWDLGFCLLMMAQLLMLRLERESEAEEVDHYLSEALSIFEELGDDRERYYTLRMFGQIRRLQKKFTEAIGYWLDAQAGLEAIGDWAVAADINWQVGDAYIQQGEVDKAFPYYRRMSDTYAGMGHKQVASMVLSKESYEAVRYRDLAYAQEIRERSLAMARQVGDLYSEAWNTWEMGEIFRVGGDAARARRWYERARTMFVAFGDDSGATFYHRGLGDLALAAGDYQEAARQFQESLNQARATSHDWAMAYALVGMGRAALGLGQYDAARKYLYRGLRRAQATSDQSVALVALAAVTALYATVGETDAALSLGALVLTHPITWRETREQVQAVLDTLSSSAARPAAPPGVAPTGERPPLWNVVAQQLQALGRPRLAPTQKAAHSLPIQPSPFVGREQELAETRDLLLDPERRLVTILGPGGIGKSRLALAVAASVLDEFANGVYFVPLAPLTSAANIVSTVADRIGFQFFEAGNPQKQLVTSLRSKQMLLIMDNFEHVLDGAAFVSNVLESAPGVKILVTSRERLRLSVESVYTLSGMDYPPAGGDGAAPLTEAALTGHSAMQLLLQRARMVRPDLEPGPAELQQMARICRLVQGMPLALVLAAGWLEMLSFEEIADEIAHSLDFLESEARDAPARQRSVRAAFDYSWRQLSPQEQRIFAALSVFRGGFTRTAAQTVVGAGLPALRSLVNKSLVSVNRKGRYEVHELLRQFGVERLEAAGWAEETRRAHSEYYLGALRQREGHLRGERQLPAMDEIDVELENLRTAWGWALSKRDFALVGRALESLHLFFYMRTRYQEGIDFLLAAHEQLAPEPEEAPHPTWGRVLARLSLLRAHFTKPSPSVEADIARSLEIAREARDRSEMAFAQLTMGCYMAYARREPAAALDHLQESLANYRQEGDSFYETLVLIWIGYCHGNATDLAHFNRYMRQALELARATGNKVYASNAISNLAAGAFCEGDYKAAERYAREALDAGTEMGLRLAMAHGRVQLSLAEFLRGNVETAERLAEEGLAQALEINYANTISYALALRSLCASIQEEYTAARDMGRESTTVPSTYFGRILAQWSLAIAHSGLQEMDAAWDHVQQTLHLARTVAYRGMLTWPLPVAALASAAEGDVTRAIELYALASHHPLSPTGWLSQWPALVRLRKRLELDAGSGEFERAWERGQHLDLDETVSQLLEGFEGDTD